jgi:hypothetical protein
MALSDHQFSLDLDDGSTPVEWGLGKDIFVLPDGFDPGDIDYRAQDLEIPNEDNMAFGRDFATPPKWTWEMATNGASELDSLDMQAALAVAWKNPKIRNTPTKRAILRYRLAGRTRRIYGRPRRWAATYNNALIGGSHQIVMDFQCADILHYDDGLSYHAIDILPAEGGFLVAPLVAPLSTIAGTERDSGFTVGGDSATWPRILFNGPVLNPYISIDGRKIALTMNLLTGQQAVIDTAPWARTVLRYPGEANISGNLTRDTRMSNMALAPGAHELIFGGTDPSGAAKVTVQWRNAWSSL